MESIRPVLEQLELADLIRVRGVPWVQRLERDGWRICHLEKKFAHNYHIHLVRNRSNGTVSIERNVFAN